MRLIRSRSRQNDATFTLAIWRTNGSSPLALDGDPNTTPPPANQILTLTHKRDISILIGTGATVRYFGIGGTTALTLQPWFYDNTRALWIKFGAPPTTITDNFVIGPPQTGGANVAVSSVGAMIGAKWWPQITINDQTTGIKKLGYDYI